MESERKGGVRRLLRRGLLRTEFLHGHHEHYTPWNDYWLWRPRFAEYKQSRHPAGHVRLATDFLEEREIWRAAVLHTVFLSKPRSLVCSSRQSQERASKHGLRRHPLRFAVNVRHIAPRALPQLTINLRLIAAPQYFHGPHDRRRHRLVAQVGPSERSRVKC